MLGPRPCDRAVHSDFCAVLQDVLEAPSDGTEGIVHHVRGSQILGATAESERKPGEAIAFSVQPKCDRSCLILAIDSWPTCESRLEKVWLTESICEDVKRIRQYLDPGVY